MRRLRRVADRDEIRQLAYRYAWGLDSRDIDAVAELWVPASVPAMRRLFRRSMSEVGVTVLFVGNHIIDFDGDGDGDGDGDADGGGADGGGGGGGADEARGLVYCRGYIETRDGPDPGRFVEQAILYRDRYRRVDGAWRFVSRGHELWFGIETAERPLRQRAADWPRHHDGVGTVPYGEPTWRSFWAEHGGGHTG
ncbi:hypothetical protein BL253_24470 [Pseudofrankia asymbiotica]|uniref:SnoaL-like domain-containing protein n=1 Tax=Pseudofrankia asymbiotica TaxID=1834516 RepID=A0A1V2I6B3_9ACTN|nr:hypothetical protein BL253_24470 [Pseudofrankia asymbiotica]